MTGAKRVKNRKLPGDSAHSLTKENLKANFDSPNFDSSSFGECLKLI